MLKSTTLKRIWHIRQANRASIGLYHAATPLALLGLYAATGVNPYVLIGWGCAIYGLICVWILLAPPGSARFFVRQSFLLWNIGVQSMVTVLVGLIDVGPQSPLLIPAANVPLSFLALRRVIGSIRQP
jgi:hypothetical protein